MMDDRYKGAQDPTIPGIRCEVTNCVYNNHHDGCTAGQVRVGPSFASTLGDTACETYQSS